MTVVEFLFARYAEREHAARAAVISAHDGPNAYQPHPELATWRYVPDGEVEYVSTPEMLAHEHHESYRVTCDSEGILPAVDESVGPHIALNDPAYVLADIATKREIIRCYEEMVERRDHFRELGFKTGATEAALESYEHVLRCWARQHDDHPDYSTDWWPMWGPMRPREAQPS